MTVIGIIPARLASTRFPDKPLAKILGMPMIGHVYKRSKMCRVLSEVYVATCDRAIADYVDSLGGKSIMTADTHERASERTAEALTKVERATKKKVDIVVLIQGDEPMVTPGMISSAVRPIFKDKRINVVNIMEQIQSQEEHEDPNEVKVVVDTNNFALYFSREAIPSKAKAAGPFRKFKQVCIIPFRRDFLLQYIRLKQTPLEIIESVDMNRILEHGMKVKMVYSGRVTYSVDTVADLKAVESAMKNDPLVKKYL